MSGSIKVLIIMPGFSSPAFIDWLSGGAAQGQWQVDGGALQDGGATVAGLDAGDHVVSFTPANGIEQLTPAYQTVTIADDETTITAGTYNVSAPSSLLESATIALEETPTHALNTHLSTPLFLACSSMDAAFSAYPGYGPLAAPGEAYTAALVMGAHFDQIYTIMLEGGEIASDFASQAELDAISAIVEPYLTGIGDELPGGVPIRCGYLLQGRKVNSWQIQRGIGFSLQPAIDAGFIAGYTGDVMVPWTAIGSVPGPPQTVSGFAVAFNGLSWPDDDPGNCTGMGGIMPYFPSPVSGYPSKGGANISLDGSVSGSVSINTVNDDGTINAAFGYAVQVTATGSSVYLAAGPLIAYTDFYCFPSSVRNQFLSTNIYLSNTGGGTTNGACIPPAYFVGSPDWTVTFPGSIETWTWNGFNQIPAVDGNPQINNMPAVLIMWIGIQYYNIPLFDCASFGPGSPPNIFSPLDRNARVTETTNGTISPFNISLTNPISTSSYKLFNLQ
jgi:hypothetical protein